MSHERARRYRVQSQQESARRALQASRARARAMRGRIEADGGSVPPEPEANDLAAWMEHEAAVRAILVGGRQAGTEAERIKTRSELLAIEAGSINDPEAAAFAEFIRAAGTTAALDDLEARVAEFRQRSDTEEDRRFVIDRASEALRMLGYTVGEEFASAAMSGPVVVAAPSIPGIGIELDFQRGRAGLVTETVALTSDAGDDLSAAIRGCAAMDALDDELEALGIDVEVETETAPGAHPLKRVGRSTRVVGQQQGGSAAQAGGGA